jgi:hypothetical protein
VPDDRLESWKEIAAFLGCDERTAMRWEEVGLPIRRISGRKRSRVFASRKEVEGWRSHRNDSSRVSASAVLEPEIPSAGEITPPGFFRAGLLGKAVITGVVGGVLILLTLGFLLRNRSQPGLPSSVRFTENAVEAFDAGGRTLWKHMYPRPFDPSDLIPVGHGLDGFVRIADLLGDGSREVLVVAPLRSGPNPSDFPIVEVDCFSSRGRLLWSYVANDTLRFGDHEVRPPWAIFDVMVSRDGLKKSVWVIAADHLWGNTFVTEVDPLSGRGSIRYVNTGSLFWLHEVKMAGKTFLATAGFNNEYAKGSLALIDEKTLFAASPQTPGTRHKCLSCPAGDPDYYFVFPRSELNTLSREWLNALRHINVNGSEIELYKQELAKRSSVQTFYALSLEPTVRVASLQYGSDYDQAHQDLERSGEISHSLANCPERLHPEPVRVWTPADGWRELSIKSSSP